MWQVEDKQSAESFEKKFSSDKVNFDQSITENQDVGC